MDKLRVLNYKGTEIVFDPIDHAVNDTKYGLGSPEVYGHVKLSDDLDSASDSSQGVAATPKAVRDASDLTKATGVLAVLHGGTGRTSFSNGEVLIGNDLGGISSRPVVGELGTDPDSMNIPTEGAVRKEINRVTGDGTNLNNAVGVLSVPHGGTGKSYLTSVGPMSGAQAATTVDVPSAKGVRDAIAKHALLAADTETPGHVKVWVSGTTLFILGTGDLTDNISTS